MGFSLDLQPSSLSLRFHFFRLISLGAFPFLLFGSGTELQRRISIFSLSSSRFSFVFSTANTGREAEDKSPENIHDHVSEEASCL